MAAAAQHNWLAPGRAHQLEPAPSTTRAADAAAPSSILDLDQVLIGLYRGFGVIEKRRVIQNKLWRLVRTGRICKAKNTRNVFALVAPKRRERRVERRR